MSKAKIILEATVLYAKDAPLVYNEETKKADKPSKHKTEIHVEDEITDGDNARPSSLKLNSNISKEEFKKGAMRFEVELTPYKIGTKQAQNSIRVLKILK